MKTRLKTRLALSLSVAVMAAGAFLADRALLLRNARDDDTATARREVAQVLSAFDDELRDLESQAADWSAWDDTYDFAATQAKAYVDRNLGDASLQNNGWGVFVISDTSGHVVYARAFDLERRVTTSLPGDLAQRMHEIVPKGQHTGVLLLGGVPCMVSYGPILTSDGTGPSRGVLFVGRPVSASVVASLSSTVHMLVRISLLFDEKDEARRAALEALPASDPILVEARGASSLTGYGVVRSVDGASLLALSVSLTPLYQRQARTQLVILLVVLAALGCIMTAIASRILDSTILARLSRLSRFVEDVRSTERLSARVAESGSDEIGSLAMSVNAMLGALDQDAARLRALADMNQLQGATVREMMEFALDRGVAVTKSVRAALCEIDGDSADVRIILISRAGDGDASPDRVLPALRARAAQVVRTGRGVVDEGGLPAAADARSLSVPVFDAGRIVMMATVEGKAAPYDGNDAMQLELLMAAMATSVRKVEAQQALAESEERYRAAAAAGGQIVYDLDLSTGRIIWAGAIESLTGHNPDHFRGISLRLLVDLIHPDDRPRVRKTRRSATPGAAYHDSFRIRRRSGDYIWVEDTGVARQSGPAVRLVGALKDISDAVQAEEEKTRFKEELNHASKMEAMGRLAGGIAHDFNNLLTGILAYAGDIALSLPNDDQRRESALEIVGAAERAAALTAQLLAFGRKQVTVPRTFDLSGLVTRSLRMLERLIGEKVTLTFISDGAPIFVTADPHQIDQVLVNLAVNARDAMPAGGFLTVRTRCVAAGMPGAPRGADGKCGEWAVLSVTDTGCGLSAETYRHLFEPFYTTKEEGKGTGLGLATVYGIVRQNKGSIEVASTQGIGSTFTVFLPVAGACAEEESSADHQTVGGTETILLVEDDDMVRSIAKSMVEGRGYRVTAARSAEEALKIAAEEALEVDLVLTDMVMPGMDGRQLFERLRRRYPRVRALYMSGYAADTAGRDRETDPGTSFIRKPFSSKDLCRSIREVLDQSNGRPPESPPAAGSRGA
jgi:PAS domain S-box-containing protein